MATGSGSRVLCDQAGLAEGGQLGDPAAFVNRLNDLLVAWPEAGGEPDAGAGPDASADEGEERTGTA